MEQKQEALNIFLEKRYLEIITFIPPVGSAVNFEGFWKVKKWYIPKKIHLDCDATFPHLGLTSINCHKNENILWVPVIYARFENYYPGNEKYIGSVYCIGNRREGLYKIGRTKNFASRFAQINTACPFELEILWVNKCWNYKRAENLLHSLFLEKRIKGEWFSLSTTEIEIGDLELSSCLIEEGESF